MNMHNNELIKYPRTSHLPHSPGATSDDKFIKPDAYVEFQKLKNYVVTEKMDGGNVTMTRNHFFARSLDSGTHSWDTVAKALWAQVRHQIPEGWRVSGESLYAQRSVSYDALEGYYNVFGVWDENNVLLDWDTTVELANELNLPTVPVLYIGKDFSEADKAWSSIMDTDKSEGYVIRYAGEIPVELFRSRIIKWVRKDHVTTDASWRHRNDFNINQLS